MRREKVRVLVTGGACLGVSLVLSSCSGGSSAHDPRRSEPLHSAARAPVTHVARAPQRPRPFGVGRVQVGGFRFARRPIVVRWVVPPGSGFKPQPPGFAVYFRLTAPLVHYPRGQHYAATYVDGQYAQDLNHGGFRERAHPNCYYGWIAGVLKINKELATRRIGSRVYVTLRFRYRGLRGDLAMTARLRKQLAAEGAGAPDRRRWRELGCQVPFGEDN